ncbi:serine O-acetyltransferase EpsC [Sphingomonas sp. CFBP 13720]|uniref:serine O-acetyltransferase EpsC n=1 Tax=Sphingomonas sp. CFBP 13720 TaxID=2775302 RepID=UPI0017810DE9|nr:serine O-acetyltransferase EpsC [Sphingomonas sp. CFBP 13720]MBD8679119.1 serine acetyltransferase [Sphingomonas sp. CFBP 13720]
MLARVVRYVDSIKARDPAPRSRMEILTYPGVWALAYHRVAHRLFRARWYFAARVVNHWSRFLTSIDIHPGATIGHNFFIDHGFTVIGETAEIGDDVTIYQNVTLGGTSPDNGVAGKRHPTISDGAIIGSGAQVLGPIVIGPRARVGANAVVTKSVPEATTVVGIPARPTVVEGGQGGDPRFVPYGTPCRDTFDPQTQRIELLRCELETLRRRLDEVLAEQQDQRDRA